MAWREPSSSTGSRPAVPIVSDYVDRLFPCEAAEGDRTYSRQAVGFGEQTGSRPAVPVALEKDRLFPCESADRDRVYSRQAVELCDQTGSHLVVPGADGGATLQHLRRVARVLRTSRTTFSEEGTAVTAPALQESLQDAPLAEPQGDAFVAQQKQLVGVSDSATAGELSPEVWSTNDEGLLCYRGKIFVPAGLRNEILMLFHDDEVAGHQGGTKTCKRIQVQYYWPVLRRDVRRYVSTCHECQLAKSRHHKPYGLLAPLPAPSRPWQEISMDFITDLPPVRCEKKIYSSILVVVDRLTRYVRYIPVSSRISSDGLADEIFKHYGMPDGIVSDRGSLFTGHFWATFCHLLHCKRRLSTAFHPQTDGQTERVNQTIEQYLRTFCNKEQSDWMDKLPLAEFTYNTSHHDTVKGTPAEILMGYQPRSKGHVKGQLETFSTRATDQFEVSENFTIVRRSSLREPRNARHDTTTRDGNQCPSKRGIGF
ncbi:hypothetical protein HIM_12180 [Hirsutella minnesotensis 3608]|uniref:Integrase catalytic domain-containing protein n=1 Tax=Hirsutella minnesotensis 3608 TaxID=1043627 RepID=A0A0F7ZQT6_9HYPO|nr:hypothetical protein HIM_12180 [Hirsutella minnesotensis 3608]